MDGKPGGGVLPVKCRLEDGAFSETRLMLLHRLHLSELHCRLGWLFNLRGHYQLKYLDKFGDLITFSSEEEFQLALANHLQPELRILVAPMEPLAAVLQWPSGGPSRPAKSRKRAGFGADVGRDTARSGGQPLRDEPAERPLIQPESKSDPAPPSPPPPPPKAQTPPPPLHDGGEWQAMFHPDYLRPRTATARRSRFGCADRSQNGGGGGSATRADPQRRINTQQVQASLAGYPSDVATWASASASEYSERPQLRPLPQSPPPLPRRKPTASLGEGFVHYGIDCSRCGADPLVGWRFKCSSCPNYNLCARCFDGFSHGHGFFRLP